MKIFIVLASCLHLFVVGPPAFGQTTLAFKAESNFLVPEAGILVGPSSSAHYKRALAGWLLSHSSTPNRKCQVVTEAGFGGRPNELAIFLERDQANEVPTVVRVAAQKSLADAVTQALFDKRRAEGEDVWPFVQFTEHDVTVARAVVSVETAERFERVCLSMVSAAKYPLETTLVTHPRAAFVAHHDVRHGYRSAMATTSKGRVGRFIQALEALGEIALAPAEGRAGAEVRARSIAALLLKELQRARIPTFAVEPRRTNPPASRP
jgi:hypothetical protein